MQKQDQICQQLATIVKPDQVQPWNAIADSLLQDQISQAIAPTHTPTCIVYPRTQTELAAIVACTHKNDWTVLPCGNATKLHWGGLAQAIDVVIRTSRLTQIIEHAVGDLTITVEAGLTLDTLQKHLAPFNQWLPLDPSYPKTATLGGILATADAGVLRQRYGGARDMVIGVSMVRADGTLAKAGGRVVKNVAGYDLMKLLTGSWGTLGIISQVTLRLYPQQPSSQTLCLSGSADAIQAVTESLLASSLTPTAATVIAPITAQGLSLNPLKDRQLKSDSLPDRQFERSDDLLTLLVRFQSIPVSIDQQVGQVMAWGKHLGLQGQILDSPQESALWAQLHTHMDSQPLPIPLHPIPLNMTGSSASHRDLKQVTCKVGVVASKTVSTLDKLNRLHPGLKGWINAGNGLGMVQMQGAIKADKDDQVDTLTVETLKEMRSLCETNGGFLTLLAAPQAWKQQATPADLWGYSSNALPIMARLKQQFDPNTNLSPGRFLV